MARTTTDLINIANAGGGLVLDASKKTTSELINISNACSISGSILILKNTSAKTTSELINIANANKGHVIFED